MKTLLLQRKRDGLQIKNKLNMKTIIVTKLSKITKNKKQLEKRLGVVISNRGREIKINGAPENEYFAEQVIIALDFGFVFSDAIRIKDDECIFETLNVRDYTHRQNLENVRARIIGTRGKTLNTIRELTDCSLEVNGNQVGIIGPVTTIKNAESAVISIIQGAKQSNAYRFLEKNRPGPVVDLGLREK
jgi:KH domain-containing protein